MAGKTLGFAPTSWPYLGMSKSSAWYSLKGAIEDRLSLMPGSLIRIASLEKHDFKMLQKTQTGTWLPAWVPQSTVTVSVLLVLCSIVQSATGGYDGSMLNGLNILPSYTDYFQLTAATTGLNTASVFLGATIGTLSSGIITDRLGRRPAIFWASVITLLGIVIQTAAQNIAIVGALIAAGITLGTGQWQSTWAWRLPSLIQGIFSVLCIFILPFVPESPRWLVHEGFFEYARISVAQTNSNSDLSDPVAITVYKEILDTLEWEKKEGRTMSPLEIVKTPTARKRLLIGMSAGPFSCIAGNIIASYYLGAELATAGITDSTDQLKANVVLNVWCLACALGGTHLAARWGRKPTALTSQTLLIICLFVIGGLTKKYSDDPDNATQSLVYGDVAVMFLFQGFYSIAWTPLLYLYPPEIMNYSIRANGLAFSAFMLNVLACVFVFIMPIGLENIGWKMYMVNGSWDVVIAVLIAVFWVETKGRTLEEIDAIFEGHKHSSVPDVEKVRLGQEKVDVAAIEQQLQRTLRLSSLNDAVIQVAAVEADCYSTRKRIGSVAAVQAKYIVPGARWRDTDGYLVNAHAGNVVLNNGTFWWFGEYKIEGQEEGGGVSVYSSDDLATWESHGLALEPVEGHPYISPEMIIQRPKVVYSEPTGQYHMWWHADKSSYGLLLQGLATSDTIAGPYTFANATAPLGNWSQDFGMFTDYKDGRSYALYSNGDSVEGRDIYLTSYNEEVSALDSVTHRFDKYDLEAPSIVQTDKSYYALMSHKTGYRPNNVVAFRADSLSGAWSQPWIVAPLNTRTFNSQSGFTLRIQGEKQTTYLYLGDQAGRPNVWDSNSLWESRYIWLPMAIDDEKKSLELQWHDIYDLDVKSGEWKPVEGTAYHGSDATTNGTAFKQEANFASNGMILTGIYGNDSTVTFSGIQGTGKPQWVSFYYQNTDDMGFGDQPGGSPDRIGGAWQLRRASSVVVNGNTEDLETLFQRDTHKGIILSTPLQLTLEEGSANTITIGGLYNGIDYKGADIDKIVVYPPES
ncbi:Uu.00g140950.m01.CDS01 [Anthostomella pinea]|uniref:Uu.00g140950.m01.CDS01 n=1 Tax=Anthostomella pinea TaxID=933095 RepID=A0AAI8VQU5_9PEZI|nr:Uu.00g140950.m01.CDS01 [Anthostomella pinea]